jgi:hypothetical protein
MNKVTVLFPGGFKPLTGAHMALANRYAKLPNVEKVIMLVGPKERDGISRDDTKEIFNIINKNSKIKMESAALESPLAAAYEYLFEAPAGTFALAAGGKDDDYARVGQFVSSIDKYKTVGDRKGRKINPAVNVVELKVSVAPLKYENGKPISASTTRDALRINDYETFAQSYPGIDNKIVSKVYSILKGTDKIFGNQPEPMEEQVFTRNWWKNVFEGLDEDNDPCWTGYKQVGTKKKSGRTVPNCVPESVNEVDLPGNTWKDFDLRKLSAEDLQIIWDMYTNSYAKQGLDFSADDYKELQQKYKAVYLQDVDSDSIADAFIVYKETPYGNRISLLGTNNKPEAKSNVVKQLIRLVNTNGWILEASKKIEEIMQRSNAPVITDRNVIQAIAGDKEVKFLEDGYYERKLSKSSTRIIKRLYGKPKTSGIRESKLNEGGAGGHMSHPFDITSVNTGKDLVRVFVQSEDYLTRKPASVKIDGVNASIRLVNVQGKPQFVLDRGSNKPLDVKGITKADLLDRFGAGHGMIEIGGKVIDIFDEAIPDTTNELKRLGMWDNPNILFNIEYVAGSTNVLSYNKNFLAIHGLLEIEQVTPKRRATHEIAYNKKVLQDYINKLAPTANKFGYEVLGSVPTTLESAPDFAGELSKKYTIVVNGKKQTKSLNDWLSTAKNPKDTMIKTKDGKTIGALSKQVLLNITNGMDVSDFVADPKDYQAAMDGYIFYLATMELGNAVLEVLSSPLGKVSEHEGIVIRDPKIYSKPFKITGRFIVKGLESQFR